MAVMQWCNVGATSGENIVYIVRFPGLQRIGRARNASFDSLLFSFCFHLPLYFIDSHHLNGYASNRSSDLSVPVLES